LALLRSIDPGESDLVLSLGVVEDGDRVAIGDTDYAAFDHPASGLSSAEGER
jgi:hypothetical protein